eukprot:2505562-Prymnesium_polylepis.1
MQCAARARERAASPSRRAVSRARRAARCAPRPAAVPRLARPPVVVDAPSCGRLGRPRPHAELDVQQ